MQGGKLFLIILGFLGATASVCAGDITVSDIDVAVHGTSSLQAKENAINVGHEKAFEALGEHYPALSSLKPSVDVIMGLVSGFNVNKEHISPTTYKATMTFHFNSDAIEAFLQPKEKPVVAGFLAPQPQTATLHEKGATIALGSMDDWVAIQALLTGVGYKIIPTTLTRDHAIATLTHPLPYAAWPGVLRTVLLDGKDIAGVFSITKAPR